MSTRTPRASYAQSPEKKPSAGAPPRSNSDPHPRHTAVASRQKGRQAGVQLERLDAPKSGSRPSSANDPRSTAWGGVAGRSLSFLEGRTGIRVVNELDEHGTLRRFFLPESHDGVQEIPLVYRLLPWKASIELDNGLWSESDALFEELKPPSRIPNQLFSALAVGGRESPHRFWSTLLKSVMAFWTSHFQVNMGTTKRSAASKAGLLRRAKDELLKKRYGDWMKWQEWRAQHPGLPVKGATAELEAFVAQTFRELASSSSQRGALERLPEPDSDPLDPVIRWTIQQGGIRKDQLHLLPEEFRDKAGRIPGLVHANGSSFRSLGERWRAQSEDVDILEAYDAEDYFLELFVFMLAESRWPTPQPTGDEQEAESAGWFLDPVIRWTLEAGGVRADLLSDLGEEQQEKARRIPGLFVRNGRAWAMLARSYYAPEEVFDELPPGRFDGITVNDFIELFMFALDYCEGPEQGDEVVERCAVPPVRSARRRARKVRGDSAVVERSPAPARGTGRRGCEQVNGSSKARTLPRKE